MNDLKDFLTGDKVTTEEQEIFNKKIQETNKLLFDSLPKLRKVLVDIQDGQDIELTSRSMNLSMPSIYWEALDKVVEIYQLREEFNIKISDTEADQIQDNIMKTYQEKTKSSLIEIMVSQFLLDTLLSFTIQVSKNQLLDRLQSIIDSNDPEALLRLIQSYSGELTDESDDPDDDSET